MSEYLYRVHSIATNNEYAQYLGKDAPWKKYVSPTGFSVDIPHDWLAREHRDSSGDYSVTLYSRAKEKKGGKLFTFPNKTTDYLRQYIHISTQFVPRGPSQYQEASQKLKESAEREAEEYRAGTRSRELVSYREIMIDGKRGYQIVLHDKKNMDTGSQIAFLLRPYSGSHSIYYEPLFGIIINYVAPDGTYSEEIATKIIQSFKEYVAETFTHDAVLDHRAAEAYMASQGLHVPTYIPENAQLLSKNKYSYSGDSVSVELRYSCFSLLIYNAKDFKGLSSYEAEQGEAVDIHGAKGILSMAHGSKYGEDKPSNITWQTKKFAYRLWNGSEQCRLSTEELLKIARSIPVK